ncbi:MAG: GNAT family N-acetyltransferase, partial [Alphaproteobacteria bacterium]|nr:GNAT family N-acetyltransferase [Alphaproteobacteria bacterium]
VTLDLDSAEAVAAAAEAMQTRVAAAAPDARLDGFVVQSMIRRRDAFELIAGMSEDPQFGPVVLFGEGGTAVEVLGDTAMALPPLDAALAQELIEQTRIHRLLRGYRGRPPADMAGIVETLVRVAQLAADFSVLKELDINPLLADSDGVLALDARMRIDADAKGAVGDEAARLAIKPYPNALTGTLDLPDGRRIPVRPILPTDGPHLQELIRRTNREDIRLRFLHAMKILPDALAARLSQIDYAREMAFVATEEADGGIIGVSRLAGDANNERAEFAVMVRSDWKGQGLGYALMVRLIEYARDRGLKELFGDVLAENRPMLTMCRELGFAVETTTEDPQLCTTALTL